MPYVMSIDQGTTSSRTILFDPLGTQIAVAQQEFRQIYPKTGWVEHDATEIWETQLATMRDVLAKASIAPSLLAAIGITNQRETTVIWNRQTGEPIHHAIVWQDRRTASICDKLKNAGASDTIRRKTGLVIDAYFSGTKVAWLLDNVPGARSLANQGQLAFGTIDSWLLWKLTGGKIHATDVSNASRTMLYNIHTGDWDDELLRLLNVPREVLPKVRASSEVYGEIDSSLLGKSIPVAGIAGDQQSALFGQMCTRPGMAKNTYGTGCFMLLNTGTEAVESRNQLLTTVGWKIGDKTEYALEGSVFIGGAVVQWLRDGLGIIKTSRDVQTLASQVEDSGDVYLVPAFAGLGSPHWDPYARGTIVGITRGTTAAHIARAAVDSIAFQVADLLDAMHQDSGLKLTELRVDGGATADNLLLQIQADLLGIPVVRPTVTETTALGAAYLAGLAVGFWKSVDNIAGQWQVDRRFEPSISPELARKKRARWSEAVERSKGWHRDELHS